MNLFALTIWAMAFVSLGGHLFCLRSLRGIARGPRRTDARTGLVIGLLIVAANLAQLVVWSLPTDHRGPWGSLIVAAPIAAAIASFFAIRLMRRSASFDVQSIGIAATVVSLFSMASVLALGSLTIAG